MANFLNEIQELLNGEEVEAIVIGNNSWGDYGLKGKVIPPELFNKVVDWDIAKQYLNYEYDDGYGAPECHAVYVYTKARILFVNNYDGSTSLCAIPRHPIDCKPIMPGGG